MRKRGMKKQDYVEVDNVEFTLIVHELTVLYERSFIVYC